MEYGLLAALISVAIVASLQQLSLGLFLTYMDVDWALTWDSTITEAMQQLWDAENDGGGIDAVELQFWADNGPGEGPPPDWGSVMVNLYDVNVVDGVLDSTEYLQFTNVGGTPTGGGHMRAYIEAKYGP